MVFMKQDKNGKITLNDEETKMAAEAILNVWLREDEHKAVQKGKTNEK